MAKNIYLTPSEQRTYNVIRDSDVISHAQIRSTFPDIRGAAINKTISSLLKKGYLCALKRGIYLVQAEPSENPQIQDPYKVALSLTRGYIGFSSALRLYDLTDYEPFTIYVVTRSSSGQRALGQYEFKSVSFGKRATGITHYKNVYVSTLPKTFFDCFYKPSYAGGYGELTKALHSSEKFNWDEFLSYFRKFGSSSLCQRTGYVLELMTEAGCRTPAVVLQYMRGRIAKKTRLYPSMPSKGKYIRNWNLTDNVGKDSILGWLHG